MQVLITFSGQIGGTSLSRRRSEGGRLGGGDGGAFDFVFFPDIGAPHVVPRPDHVVPLPDALGASSGRVYMSRELPRRRLVGEHILVRQAAPSDRS